jgi:hypothetical protein
MGKGEMVNAKRGRANACPDHNAKQIHLPGRGGKGLQESGVSMDEVFETAPPTRSILGFIVRQAKLACSSR